MDDWTKAGLIFCALLGTVFALLGAALALLIQWVL